MDPREEKQLTALLEGRMSALEARKFLDSMKGREDFRERMLFAADSVPTAGFSPADGLRYKSYSFEDVIAAKQARPKRRMKWLAFSVFMVVLLTMVGIITDTERKRNADDVDTQCRESIVAGLPYLIHPKGEQASLPRIFELVLPAWARSATIRLRQDGVVLLEKRWQPTDRGAEFHEAEGLADGETFPLLQAFLPFPRPDQVSLKPGEIYDYIAQADDGSWSAPREFSLER